MVLRRLDLHCCLQHAESAHKQKMLYIIFSSRLPCFCAELESFGGDRQGFSISEVLQFSSSLIGCYLGIVEEYLWINLIGGA